MLGMRGVRLGITVPEIYEMQARAIFEAAVRAGAEGQGVVPEIMIPLVSAMREVELVRENVDNVADAVRREPGRESPGPHVADLQQVHHRRHQDRTDDAREDHQDGGQRRVAAERLRDPHGDARSHRFRRQRDENRLRNIE